MTETNRASLLETIKAFQQEAPVKVEKLIEALGLELVRTAKLHPEIAGQIERVSEGRFRISANSQDFYYRRRFTMAHELGHYILHRDLIGEGTDDNRAYRSVSAGRFFNTRITREHEAEANRFAANLLMPRHLVESLYRECGGDPDAMSKKLQVSAEALGHRLRSLNLSACSDAT